MKKICLVRDDRKFWETIEKYLGDVNAEAVLMAGDCGSDDVLAQKPDLVIANALFHHSISRRLKQYPIIVIKEGTPPVTMAGTSSNRNLIITGWPLQKGDFLEMTSQMLAIPPRKVFRTIIRVYAGDDEIGSLGQSVDFSLSGIAFKTSREFSVGSRIIISVTLPETEERLRLHAVIQRCNLAGRDGNTIYGASMKEIPAADKRMLRDFILGA